MVSVVSENIAKIAALCTKMQVESLYLFGSAARENDFTANSDLDFVYRFKKNEEGFPVGGYDYFDLMFQLEEITGKKIDLVAEEKIRNRFFLERITKEKVKIYES